VETRLQTSDGATPRAAPAAEEGRRRRRRHAENHGASIAVCQTAQSGNDAHAGPVVRSRSSLDLTASAATAAAAATSPLHLRNYAKRLRANVSDRICVRRGSAAAAEADNKPDDDDDDDDDDVELLRAACLTL